MSSEKMSFTITVEGTTGKCAVGEDTGRRNMAEGRIPVLSCEGGCIRGEIARVAANMIAREDGFARGCHGELITVPDSAIARWIKSAEKVVLIDGCFLSCHARMLRDIVGAERLAEFDALSFYKKYTDVFGIDDVPEEEREAAARVVADAVLDAMRAG
ncbi:MAG: putative zinc-binding protein [Planctomycetota bacterium]|jgi:hypothetical protein